MSTKNIIKYLSNFGLEINYALDNGFSFLGFNISKARYSLASRSFVALSHCLRLKPETVLDVGSGGGEHASAFAEIGAKVTCIDFGTSVYAVRAQKRDDTVVINVDFSVWETSKTYQLVWASHVLEHQRNIGLFLDKLIKCCEPGGFIAITVPIPHRRLWGGHLSLWSPGLLAYSIVLCGIDLSGANIMYGYREISIVFSPKKVVLPSLTFDSGDLDKLRHLLPYGFRENADAWI